VRLGFKRPPLLNTSWPGGRAPTPKFFGLLHLMAEILLEKRLEAGLWPPPDSFIVCLSKRRSRPSSQQPRPVNVAITLEKSGRAPGLVAPAHDITRHSQPQIHREKPCLPSSLFSYLFSFFITFIYLLIIT
jgi:hypothetical protein